VILNAEKVTDEQSDTIAFDLSQRITKEMKFPGQIKITVIREKRSVGFAK
jgi:ribonuclease Y